MIEKRLKKAAMIATTLALVLGMTVTSFAATLSDGVYSGSSTTVDISKNLQVVNPTLTSVDGPGMSYSYAIASETPATANGGTSVTDGTNTSTVKAGPTDGVTLTTSTVSFPVGTAVNASASGADNIKYITASADLTKFSTPGIYRYKITETETVTASSVGVEDNVDKVRYLDIYIENGDSGLAVAGFVLHDKDNNKTEGFNEDYEDSETPGTPSDTPTIAEGPAKFETVNVTLTNVVSGNMGDKTFQFPFAGTISDNSRYFFAKKGETPTASDQVSGTSVSTTLANGEVYYISGLSKVATVAYTETNGTPDSYNVSITGGTESAASAVEASATKSMTATAASDATAVTFTNARDSVSPTGVVMRYGAPLLVLAAAIVLVVLNRKTKNANN